MDDAATRLEQLEAQLERMRSIFSRTSEALFCWELVEPVAIDAPLDVQIPGLADAVLVECNEVAAVGYGYGSAAEILGKHSREIWQRPPPNQAQLYRAFCGANYELSGFCLSVDYPDGTTRVFENDVFGVVEDGKVVRMWGAARDISERLELEAELLRTQKLDVVGRLAGAVAHDFNNLLTAILGGVELLRETPGNAELLDMVHGAAERSAKLTRRMLGLSRHAVVSRRAVEPALVLAQLEPLLTRLLAPDLRLRTRVIGPAGEARVFMDETHLEQVVLNLVVNARDAVREQLDARTAEPELIDAELEFIDVELALEPDEDTLRLSVIDRGPGMSAELQAKVFEPFFTTKGADQGTGLGLDTVRRVVTDAHGRVTIDSAPGQGCAMHVSLPRHVASGGSVRAASVDARAQALPREPVFVIDDEPVVRSLMGRTLRREGYDAREFDSTKAARDALDTLDAGEGVALIVTDVQMRGSSGPSFVRRLRRDEPELPVLFVSGFAPEQLELDEGGHTAFLAKPFGGRELLDAVAALLQAKGAQAAPAL